MVGRLGQIRIGRLAPFWRKLASFLLPIWRHPGSIRRHFYVILAQFQVHFSVISLHLGSILTQFGLKFGYV